MIRRREFVRDTAFGAAALLLAKPARLASTIVSSAADARIEILLDEVLGTISPNIYGHFLEHIGGVIYDGVWVGENSKIPNINGIRKDLVDEMRQIKAPVVRYPGGCFADSYDWRDGVGPADKRPRRTNFWNEAETSASPAIHRFESNQFGTDEFMRFCKAIGCQPYLAANVRSLPAEVFYRWVEYCNSPPGSTTLSEARAAAGSTEPYDVRYWGVGNESWGCGGNFTAQEYAVEFRRYTTWLPRYGQSLSLIASGPNSDDWQWTRRFFEEISRKDKELFSSIFGWALHYYSWNLSQGHTEDWDAGKGNALKFEAVDWYEILRQGNRLESLIEGHWQAMGEFDPTHQVKLVVDEWGPWYRPGSQLTPNNFLEQTPTLRDAVFSAMTLDMFNRHPEKITLASPAQLINCLNSLYLAHEDKFCVTPVGHVFGMYSAHQGSQAVRTIVSTSNVHYVRDGKSASFWGLQGSASLQGKDLTLTLVNPSVSEIRETEIVIRGATIKSGAVTTLTHTDLHARNTFDQRNDVTPQVKALSPAGRTPTVQISPASVTKLELTLM
ncbi:MAG TPA: alpha-L-arabinofuranosidase C-terminal domain-containing protein [Candidatus Aquilonibacter sp.]|jgi:alpha-N-arabinofuranosidase|nr:alpha-L-arabinofuranosidase C-terminal domain-containing protein [Candidatus Aquilonibacter sp.]